MTGRGVGGAGGMPRYGAGKCQLHRAVGRMEKSCLIPSFCPGIVEGGVVGGWNLGVQWELPTRCEAGGGEKASITRCLPEQANSAQN